MGCKKNVRGKIQKERQWELNFARVLAKRNNKWKKCLGKGN